MKDHDSNRQEAYQVFLSMLDCFSRDEIVKNPVGIGDLCAKTAITISQAFNRSMETANLQTEAQPNPPNPPGDVVDPAGEFIVNGRSVYFQSHAGSENQTFIATCKAPSAAFRVAHLLNLAIEVES
jgi:hypothetical protein